MQHKIQRKTWYTKRTKKERWT